MKRIAVCCPLIVGLLIMVVPCVIAEELDQPDSSKMSIVQQYLPMESSEATGLGIVLPQSGLVKLFITSTSTSSLHDVLGLESPYYEILTTNARDSVGARITVGSFEAGTELVFFLDNEDPITGPQQVTVYPQIVEQPPIWTLNFEDYVDMDWNDVVCVMRIFQDTIVVVKELTAQNDIEIDGVGNLIWRGVHDDTGKLVSFQTWGPVADAMKAGDNNAAGFGLGVTFEGIPAMPSYTPTVQCKYSFSSLPNNVLELHGSSEMKIGNLIPINVPQKMGLYKVTLDLTVTNNNGYKLSSDTVTIDTFYVTYGDPLITANQALPTVKKLKTSVPWVSGLRTSGDAAGNINSGIYSYGQANGWLYRDISWPNLWSSILEGEYSVGNCVAYSDMWYYLCRMHGIREAMAPIRIYGQFIAPYVDMMPFVTKPATSMDGLPGNLEPCGDTTKERWLFGMHQIGKYNESGVTAYFDPTFGEVYNDSTEFIEWYVNGIDASERAYTDDGNHWIRVINNDPPWGRLCYEDQVEEEMVETVLLTNPYIVGISAESPVDDNGDGYYERLTLGIDVYVATAGMYTLVGWLKTADAQLVSYRSNVNSVTSISGSSLTCEKGIATFDLIFSGQDIYESGEDGGFLVDCQLVDVNGSVVGTSSIATAQYEHSVFREQLGEIDAIADSGIDINEDGLYDSLEIGVSILSAANATYELDCGLYKDGTFISRKVETANMSTGATIKAVRFSGVEIRDSGLDGPYDVIISLSRGGQDDQKSFSTAEYSSSAFNYRRNRFSGIFSSSYVDTNANSLYDYVDIMAMVEVEDAGNYVVTGWLCDGEATKQIVTETELSLSAGASQISLRFSGTELYRMGRDYGVNGPYSVSYMTLSGDAGVVDHSVDNACITADAVYTDFERPPVQFVGYTGDFGWPDLFYDVLIVNANIIAANSGFISYSAGLYDLHGSLIQDIYGINQVSAGVETLIALRFEGKRIWGNLENGPYYVRNVAFYDADCPGEEERVSSEYVTAYYPYAAFDRGSAVRGKVTDAAGAPVVGASISIEVWDEDKTNEQGEYSVCVLNPGSYSLAISGPNGSSVEQWGLFVNDELLGTGNSIELSLEYATIVDVNIVEVLPGDEGFICGTVADDDGNKLLGVTVELYDEGNALIDAVPTDVNGWYGFSGVPAGLYTVHLIAPIKYSVSDGSSRSVSVYTGVTTFVNFLLSSSWITYDTKTSDYWKLQVNSLITNKGKADFDEYQLSWFMDRIRVHFNENLVCPVTIFDVPQPASWLDSASVLLDLLSVGRKEPASAYAVQQLTALLLNIVSNFLHQSAFASVDNATVSQAIVYCNDLIFDADSGNDTLAVSISETINAGLQVAAGVIPLSTLNVIFKPDDESGATGPLPETFSLSQNYPNPFNPHTEIFFGLPHAEHVRIEIYNVVGQRVATLLDRRVEAGNHSVMWDGSGVATGLYVYRIVAGDFTESKKMILVK